MTRRDLLGPLLAIVCAACTPDVTPEAPFTTAPTSTSTPDVSDAGPTSTTTTDAGTDAGTTPSGPSTFIGTLDATAATEFGGGAGHCTYDVTLKSVSIEIDVNPSGQIIGGTATDTMDETLVGTCVNAPLGIKPQTFSFATANGNTLSWVEGASDTGPATSLSLSLTKTGASYQAAATWTRTDRTDDLKWVVKTQITLGAR